MHMHKLLVRLTAVLVIISIIGSLFIIPAGGTTVPNNEPNVVKKQLLIESAKITDVGMQAAKEWDGDHVAIIWEHDVSRDRGVPLE